MPLPYAVPVIPFDGVDAEGFIRRYIARDAQDEADVWDTVMKIVTDVRQNGDEAVLKYTKAFDHADLTPRDMKVTAQEIENACAVTSAELKATLAKSVERIRRFHAKQMQTGWIDAAVAGEVLGQIVRPIDRCGIYVPGGTAALASSLLMIAVPAQVAGVRHIIVATPCGPDGTVNPAILAAAAAAGVTEIYKIGGAQAIAAMAYGTATVPKVDKIAGPGNIYVMTAKRAVFGHVGIDSTAGPSEIAIIADESANPTYVAADMLSQAEHDLRAASILITTSSLLAEAVQVQLADQAAKLPRKAVIAASLAANGFIFLTDSLDDAARLSDAIAPEHLMVCTREPFHMLSMIRHAGAVFLGHYTPESLGDYMAGPSHVLPTESTARFFSPLSVDDFVKKSSVLSFSAEAMERLKPDVIRFAEAEGLSAHANALRVRETGI